MRQKVLKLIEEPMCETSSTDKHEPRQVMPYTDTELPNLVILLRERLEHRFRAP
jgi:hypothetical protein